MTRDETRGEIDHGKRNLLKVAGVSLATSVLTLSQRAEAASKSQYDVIVVGAGSAGMMLAIFAAARKVRVLLVEAAPIAGGTLPLSGGSVTAAGTVFQKNMGVVDTPDMHFIDTMRISKGTADPNVTRLFADNAGQMMNWLAERGYTLNPGSPTATTGHEDFSVPRYHASKDSGKGIYRVIGPIFDKLVESGAVTLQLNTKVVDLLQDAGGKVIGVVTEAVDGPRREEFAHNIVLASGGCASNPRMFADLHEGVPLYGTTAYSFSQGMGITLGVGAGGYIWGRDKYIPQFGTILSSEILPSSSSGSPILAPGRRQPWEIYVNSDGLRFVKEDETENWIREWALREQTGHRFWAIFDQEAMDKAPQLVGGWAAEKYKAAFDTHPMFARAQTLRELAVKAGINPANLVTSATGYNTALTTNRPDPWRRASRPAPIAKAPFYAIRMNGWTPCSFAGLAIDGNLRVITPNGAPIPNLYAIGEVTGGATCAGNRFVGGSILTPALTFGKLLGEQLPKFKA